MTTINGRTPEEIKRGLECYDCKTCPYEKDNCGNIDRDVLAYIQQLEDHFREVTKMVQQLERERDEARRDADKLKHAAKEATDNYFVMLRERDEARNDLDTLNYVVAELHSAYDAMKRERDAAVAELKKFNCTSCIHEELQADKEPCAHCNWNWGCKVSKDLREDHWQWRGVQEVEN